jgi:hypothetical protein
MRLDVIFKFQFIYFHTHWPDQVSFFSFLQPFSHTCGVKFYILYATIFSHVTCGMTYCGDMMEKFFVDQVDENYLVLLYLYESNIHMMRQHVI